MLTGHNFKTGAVIQIGGGTLAPGDITALTVTSITFNIPNRALNALAGLSSGTVLVNCGGITNAAQTARNMDLFR